MRSILKTHEKFKKQISTQTDNQKQRKNIANNAKLHSEKTGLKISKQHSGTGKSRP